MSVDEVLHAIREVLDRDLEGRELRSLETYQRMFAGHEAQVSAEFERLTQVEDEPETIAGAAEPETISAPAERPAAMRAPEQADGLLERLAASDTPRYVKGEEIARGGMGAIHSVRDERLNRELAMKVVLGAKGGTGAGATPQTNPVLDRFLAEAQVTAQLDHPGVVPVHDLGLDAEGRLYFTMKLVRGRTLGEIFELVRAEQERWTRTRAVQLIVRVLETLAFAHSKGVVHRDLKPANVMVGDFGEVYVMDWGVAKVLGGRADAAAPEEAAPSPVHLERRDSDSVELSHESEGTVAGTVIGTPSYMSPEQATGRLDDLDARSDIYSTGAMLYELLVGAPPYDDQVDTRSAWGIVAACEAGPPTPVLELVPDLPGEIAAVAEKAMARRRVDRYASADEMEQDLRNFVEGRVVRAYRTGALIEMRKWVLRNKALAAAIGIAVVLLVVGLVTNSALLVESRREATNARRQAYRFGMNVAARAVAEHDPRTARANLDAVPELARGWEWRYLDARLRDAQLEIEGFGAVFDDAGSLVVIGADRSVRRIDLDTGSEEIVWPAGERFPFHLTADGRCVILGRRDALDTEYIHRGTLADLETGEELFVSPDDSNYGYMARHRRVLHRDGDQWRVLDLETRETLATGEAESATCLFTGSPDGNLFAGLMRDAAIELLDASTLERVALLEGHTEKPFSITFAPNGSRAVTCGIDGTARSWLLPSGEAGPWTFELPRGGNLFGVDYHPAGRAVAATAMDKTTRLLRTADGSVARVLMGTHEFSQFSPDGNRFVSCDYSRILIFDTSSIEDPAVLRGHQSFVYDVAFSPDGQRLASAAWDGFVDAAGSVRIWDVESGAEIAEWGPAGRCATSIDWSPDGVHLYVSIVDDIRHTPLPAGSAICVLDAATGTLVRKLEGGSRVAPSPDGALLVTSRLHASYGEDVALIHDLLGDAAPGTLTHRTGPGLGFVGPRLVASHSDHFDVILVDLTTGATTQRLAGHGSDVWSIRSSPDGRRVVTAADDGTARVWDIATGEQLAVLGGHGAGALSATYSPDGSRIVVGGRDGRVHVWHAETYEEIVRLTGHDSYVTDVEFSADGETLATCSGDGTVRLWSAAPTGDRVAALRRRKELTAKLGPRVSALFEELGSASAVAERLRADPALLDREREVALQLVLAESLRQIRAGDQDR